NAYGVQCALPLSRKWMHLDTLCLTDPFLMLLHGATVMGWVFGLWGRPEIVSTAAWVITIIYVGWRIVHHEFVFKRLRRRFRRWRAGHLLPSLWWFRWYYVIETDEGFEMGRIDGKRILPTIHLLNVQLPAFVKETRRTRTVQTLLRFAKRAYA